MTKSNLGILFFLLSLPLVSLSQKPKKTHNYEKFAKKAIMSMAYIEKMCPDETALSFISEKTGVSISELQERQASNLEMIKEDIQFIMDNSIFGTQGAIELINVIESPIKTADIVVHYSNKNGAFTYVLTNCIQTNISWYLGDGIDPRGEGVKEIIASRAERKKKAENGLWGKLKDLEEKVETAEAANQQEQAYMDSLNALRTGHVAKPFPMQGIDRSSEYYQHQKLNLPLSGYYVTLDGSIVPAVIAYQAPEFLVGDLASASSLFICKEDNGQAVDVLNSDQEPNFKEYVPKDKLQAFFVGGQLFANIENVGWRIVTTEGAIHTFVTMVKVTSGNGSTYQTFEQTQKLEGEVHGSIMKGPSTDVLTELLSDCPELAKELSEGATPNTEMIIRYNRWYDATFPAQIKYIPTLKK